MTLILLNEYLINVREDTRGSKKNMKIRQRGNQELLIEQGQIIQWPKERGQKYRQ